MKVRTLLAAGGFAFCSSAPAFDAWENGSLNDDFVDSTGNTLVHGAPPQEHDLQATMVGADVDWFIVIARPRRSYEVLASNVTRNTALESTSLQRMNGVSVLQGSAGLGAGGHVRALRWIESDPAVTTNVRATGPSTGDASSIYTIQLRETTLYCPRYNNTATQISILILQHTSPEGASGGLCSFEARFHNPSGGETGSKSGTLFTNAMQVISTPDLTGTTSGSAFIAHTCGWGGLKAKLVALEPATGYSFDTICTPRET